jgi:hypothetical protein
MKANYNYPKNEFEFYARQYSVKQLVDNYSFDTLMAYYLFGMNTLNQMDYIINNDLFDEVGTTPMQVGEDKTHFMVRTYVTRVAMERLGVCQIEQNDEDGRVMVITLN